MVDQAPPDGPELTAALKAAREEALRYRRAYELVSAAFSQNAGELYGERARRDALDHARLVRLYGPKDVVCYDYWLNAGAVLTQEPYGAVIATPAQAWHYAAGVPVDFSGVDFASEDCWVRVRLAGIAGQVGAALYDGAVDAIAAQVLVEEAPGVHELVLPAKDAAASLLLVRNGALDRSSHAIFLGAEILAGRKPAAAGKTPDKAPEQPPANWRDLKGLRGTRDRAALALIDRWAPVLERRGPMLDRRILQPLARLGRWWRGHVTTPRTLWGVTPILTLPLLARADRLLGLRSRSVVYTNYVITGDFDVNFKRLAAWLYERRPQWLSGLQSLILHLSRLRFDAYHYFNDRGLSPQNGYGLDEAEMKLIRDSGHRLYTYAYGGDVRTRLETLALGPHNLCRSCPAPGTLCICDDARGEENQQTIAGYANAVVSMGDMTAYAPGARVMPYWPMDVARSAYVGVDWTPERPLRVAHAPNHPYFKGTSHLLDAIARLQDEGRAIELVRVQGVPNAEVLRLFAGADLVADQFVAGAHGYTAFEAMLLGKPVLCYLRDPSMVIEPDACPMINTWPESIYQTLKDCLDGRLDLAELGRRSRSYVEHCHSIEAVALRLGQMYLDTAGFPDRINRRLRRRMTGLAARLPPLRPGSPPTPWMDVPGANPRPALAA
jgi:hypothetical protein